MSWHSRSMKAAEPYSGTSESTLGSASGTRVFSRTRTLCCVE